MPCKSGCREKWDLQFELTKSNKISKMDRRDRRPVVDRSTEIWLPRRARRCVIRRERYLSAWECWTSIPNRLKHQFLLSNSLLPMTDPKSPAIAFLGLGLMGRPMAARLLAGGFALTVWNRSPDKTTPLLELGARGVVTATEAVRHADIIITMLDSGPVVADVIAAALPDIAPGALVIDMSSTAQSEAVALGSQLRSAGVMFVDAPVSGGVAGAQAGTLAIMAGGSIADYARAEPVLRVLGNPTRVGPMGCGQLAKLCNQLIVGGTISIVAEALLLAQVGGADPGAVRAAIRGGFAESRILEVHGQRMLDRNFIPGGQVRSQAKDMENILNSAQASGLQLPVTEVVTTLYRSIREALPHADQAAALLALEQRNAGIRVGAAPDQLP